MEANELLNKLFEIRDTAHAAHLKSHSYPQHMALDTLYKDIVELFDTFTECYQGNYGIIEGIGDISISDEDITTYLVSAAECIEEAKEELTDSYLKNILDEVSALLYQTIYKLKYLK